MRNCYIFRYEVPPRFSGSKCMAVDMPVDSHTTAEDVRQYLTACVATAEGYSDRNAEKEVRLLMISLVHHVQ